MKYDGSKQILDGFLKIKQEYPFNYPVKKNQPFYKLVNKCINSCDLYAYKKRCQERGEYIPKIYVDKKEIDGIFVTHVIQVYLDDWLRDYDELQEYCDDSDPNILTVKEIIESSATDIFEYSENFYQIEEAFKEYSYGQYLLAIWSVLPEIYHTVTGGNIEVFG